MTETFDVAIVGYGPTGLVLAAALGQAGHRVVVVERWPALYGMPRLSHIDDETARIIQATADADDALQDAAPISSFRFVNAAGELLTAVGAAGQGPCGYPADISIFQPDIEAAIDRRVGSLPSVERLLGWEAVELHQDGDGVTVRLRANGAENSNMEVRARYLVGCDGARSFVRENLGITQSDFGFNERWLNIDVQKKHPLPERFSDTIQICDPARGHMHLTIGYKRVRFELAVLPGEDAATFLEPEFAWRWLREQHDLGPDDVTIIRQIVYTFEARIADLWRNDRILLAGDACHTMPPYMGQGACSGMRDGFNLGWRLDLVLRGLAADSLLDSFEVERKPHVTALTQMAIGLGKIANEHDPERARIRDEMLRSNPPSKPPFPILRDGALDPERTPLTGTVSPQGRVEVLGRSGLFDDIIGRGFVLIGYDSALGGLAPEAAQAFSAIGGRVVPLSSFSDTEGVYARLLATHGLECLLIRPDFVVFGSGASASAAARLISSLLNEINYQSIFPAAAKTHPYQAVK